MALTVKLGRTTKRNNSTEIPQTFTLELSCIISEPCSVIEPVLLISNNANFETHIGTWNYAYIQEFGRYYHITNIVWATGKWNLHLSVDVLASNKTAIGNYTGLIERTSQGYDGRLIDNLYPVKCTPVIQEVSGFQTIFGAVPSYWFIVGIIGGMDINDSVTIGGAYNGSVVYYALTQSQLYELIYSLLSSTDVYSIPTTEISEELQKQLINPIQYIHSIKCVPVLPEVPMNGESEIVATGFYAGFNLIPIVSLETTQEEPEENNENEGE